jgi:hypothetical protein
MKQYPPKWVVPDPLAHGYAPTPHPRDRRFRHPASLPIVLILAALAAAGAAIVARL